MPQRNRLDMSERWGSNHQRSAGDEDYNTLDMLAYVLDFSVQIVSLGFSLRWISDNNGIREVLERRVFTTDKYRQLLYLGQRQI